MVFYLVMFFLNMFTGVLLFKTDLIKRKEKRTKIYLFLTFIQFTLIAGCRSSEVGWDTNNYLRYFQMVKAGESLLQSINDMHWLEPGYIFLCYIVNLTGGDAQLSLMVAAVLIYGLILYFVYIYALSPLLSVMSLFCFPVFYDSLNMLRNAIVCALFLLAFKFIDERKKIKFIICTLVAASFHTLAVVFVPLYFVRFINWKNWLHTVSILGMVLVVYNWLLPIIRAVTYILGINNKYEWYTSGSSYWFGQSAGGWRTAIFYTVIVALAYLRYVTRKKGEQKSEQNRKQNILAGYALLLPASSFLYTIAPMFIRLMLMMMPVAGVFISNEIELLESRNNRVLATMGYVLLLVAFQIFTLYVNAEHYIPYIPFWKG